MKIDLEISYIIKTYRGVLYTDESLHAGDIIASQSFDVPMLKIIGPLSERGIGAYEYVSMPTQMELDSTIENYDIVGTRFEQAGG